MIKALIFDFDNCIFDTRSMGLDLVVPVVSAMTEYRGEVRIFKPYEIDELKKDLWTMSPQDIVDKYMIPSGQAECMREAYIRLEAPVWSKCYDDFGLLSTFSLPKILVTSGFTGLQMSKLRVTGMECFFDRIIIDANDDPLKRIGKKEIFRRLMAENSWQPRECMVLGDSATSELGAGKELGIVTVQTLRPQVRRVAGFSHYVSGLSEVKELIALYD